ncbi:substrate-binding domain-containing protein [Kibdelosporangium persicum]|uniref:von Willebrand factor, type A n=1 Tax=Kibdelosporangium persicum TaxID=2698649 RepID=A0ABX2EVT6_9PSEU|nr:substrate-binding domain-containing protein [Kibdelosporangium persicum]NRN63141.1 von Willebrand factor, type A [Kibdelosporangium persicum]
MHGETNEPEPGGEANEPQPHREANRPESDWKRLSLTAVLIAVGTAVSQLAVQPLDGTLRTIIFGVGVVILAVVGAGLIEWLLWLLRRLLERFRPQRIAVTVVVATLFCVMGVSWGRPAVDWTAKLFEPCPPPVLVRALTTPELLEPYRELAAEFADDEAAKDGSCRPFEVYVYALPAEEAKAGLHAGWSAEYLRKAPTPDVWLPETGMHVEQVVRRRDIDKSGPPMDVTESVGTIPIVLALPARAGLRPEDPEWQGKTWQDLVDKLRDNGIGLIRPGKSTVGEFATVAIYSSAGGATRLRENAEPARQFESWVDSSFQAGRYPAGGNHTALLGRHRELGDAGAAMVLSELDMIRHNEDVRGGPYGPGCDFLDEPPGCLHAVYPSDTYSFDLPLAVLNWPGLDRGAGQRRAIDAFKAWLGGDAGREAMVLEGIRPPPGTPLQSPLSAVSGIIPGGPPNHIKQHGRLPTNIRDEMVSIKDQVRRTSRVLISLDASGSMRERVGGQTRYGLAVKAIQDAHANLARRAEVTLNVFSATIGVRPVDLTSIGQVQPAGNTPQHRAILEGMRAAGRGGVLVLVTDGSNNVPDVTPQQVAEQSGARVLVLAFGEATCGAQVLNDVTNRTGGSCRQASVDTLSFELAELLRGV